MIGLLDLMYQVSGRNTQILPIKKASDKVGGFYILIVNQIY